MYYLLEMDDFQSPEPYRSRYEAPTPDLDPSNWLLGRHMVFPTGPLEFDLWVYDEGAGLAEVFLDTVPLFREDVLATLASAGVTNLETCPAILRDEERGLLLKNYRAVNILGLVQCADLKHSQYDDITGTGLIAMGFRKLVIDESKAHGELFFRLAESVASIIVHEKVKQALEAKRFRYLRFLPLGH